MKKQFDLDSQHFVNKLLLDAIFQLFILMHDLTSVELWM